MRYLPLTDIERQDILRKIGVTQIDDLFADIPRELLLEGLLPLPPHQPELHVSRQLSQLAQKNIHAGQYPFFIGGGAYRHHIPATVDHIIQRSEFLTSYTPYQPEITQGTLQYLFEFQTQISCLTGMDVANASLYDGATALQEAILMAFRITGRRRALLAGGVHPHYSATIASLAPLINAEVVSLPPEPDHPEKDLLSLSTALEVDQTACACVVVQTPDFFGHLHQLHSLAEECHQKGILLIVVVTELLSLGLITSPGDMGADIVVAEGQSFGNALNFGGPYIGLLATRERYLRQIPGRLCGQTQDSEGKRAFVLTLSAREQHIRRDKATSNICTNSGLCCLALTIHLSLLGQEGLRKLAQLNHAYAVTLAQQLEAIPGIKLCNRSFFNEFTLALPLPAQTIVSRLLAQGIFAGVPLARLHPTNSSMSNFLLVAVTEMNRPEDMSSLIEGLKECLA